MQEAGGKMQEAGGKMQEARGKMQEVRLSYTRLSYILKAIASSNNS